MGYQRYNFNNSATTPESTAAEGAMELLANFGTTMGNIRNTREQQAISRQQANNQTMQARASARASEATTANQESVLRARQLREEGLREASVSVAQEVSKRNEEIEDLLNRGKVVSAYAAANRLSAGLSSAHLPANATPEQRNAAMLKDELYAYSPELKAAQRQYSSLISQLSLKVGEGDEATMVNMNDVANSFAMGEDKYNKYVVGQMLPGDGPAVSRMMNREYVDGQLLDNVSTQTRAGWRKEAISLGIRPDLHLAAKSEEAARLTRDVDAYMAQNPNSPRAQAVRAVSTLNEAKYARENRDALAAAAYITNGASEEEAARLVRIDNDLIALQNEGLLAQREAQYQNALENKELLAPLVAEQEARRRSLGVKVERARLAKSITNMDQAELMAAVGGTISTEALADPQSMRGLDFWSEVLDKVGMSQANVHDETRKGLLAQVEDLKAQYDGPATPAQKKELWKQYSTARMAYNYLLQFQQVEDSSLASTIRQSANNLSMAGTLLGNDGYMGSANLIDAKRIAQDLTIAAREIKADEIETGLRRMNNMYGTINPKYLERLEAAELEAMNAAIRSRQDFTNSSQIRVTNLAGSQLVPTPAVATGDDMTRRANNSNSN